MYTQSIYDAIKTYITNNYQAELSALETALSVTISRLNWLDYVDHNSGQYPYLLIEETPENISPETIREDRKIYNFALTVESISGDPTNVMRTLNAYRDVIVSLVEKDPTFGATLELVTVKQVSPAFVGQTANSNYGGAVAVTLEIVSFDRIA